MSSRRRTQDQTIDQVLARIARTGGRLQRYLGEAGQAVATDARAEAIARLACAGLQLSLDELRAEVEALRQHASDLSAAERDWRPLLVARDRLVLTNGLGTLAELPLALARLIAQGRAVDVRVQPGDRQHLLLRAGTVVASLPRSLAPQLGAVLAAIDWDSWGGPIPVPGRSPVGHAPGCAAPPPPTDPQVGGGAR